MKFGTHELAKVSVASAQSLVSLRQLASDFFYTILSRHGLL